MLNPQEYCVSCGYRYGFADESCRNCGFDPVDADEIEQMEAEEAYKVWKLENPNV